MIRRNYVTVTAANKSDVLNKWNFFNHATHAMLYLHVLTVIFMKLILHVIVAVQTLKRYTIECYHRVLCL